MTTIIERGNDGAATALLTLVSIVIIVIATVLAFYVFQIFPFNSSSSPEGTPLNIQVNGQLLAPVSSSSAN